MSQYWTGQKKTRPIIVSHTKPSQFPQLNFHHRLCQTSFHTFSKTLEMNSIASRVFKRPSTELNSLSSQLNQWRGIRVRVFENNLERALAFMQKQMTSSGVERLIKNEQTHHIKNSEKRVLARKNLERRLKSQDLARKLKSILMKKVRYRIRKISINEYPMNEIISINVIEAWLCMYICVCAMCVRLYFFFFWFSSGMDTI